MKSLIAMTFMILAFNLYSQGGGEGKAKGKVLPKTIQAHDAKTQVTAKKSEAPCDTPKEDIIKKLEEEKKAKAEAGKGLSLQGATDTGCSIK